MKGPVIRCRVQREAGTHTPLDRKKAKSHTSTFLNRTRPPVNITRTCPAQPLESTTSLRPAAASYLYTNYRATPEGGGRDSVSCRAFSPSCCLPSSFVCAVLSVSQRSRLRTGTLPFSPQASKSANGLGDWFSQAG